MNDKTESKEGELTEATGLSEGFYCEAETEDMVDDMEELGEYLYGWPDATRLEDGKRFYRKYYVDMYVNR